MNWKRRNRIDRLGSIIFFVGLLVMFLCAQVLKTNFFIALAAGGVFMVVGGILMHKVGTPKEEDYKRMDDNEVNFAYNKGIHFFANGSTSSNEDGVRRQEIFRELADEIRERTDPETYYKGIPDNQIVKEEIEVGELEGAEIPVTLERYHFQEDVVIRVRSEKGVLGIVPFHYAEVLNKVFDRGYEFHTMGMLLGGRTKLPKFQGMHKILTHKANVYDLEVKIIFTKPGETLEERKAAMGIEEDDSMDFVEVSGIAEIEPPKNIEEEYEDIDDEYYEELDESELLDIEDEEDFEVDDVSEDDDSDFAKDDEELEYEADDEEEPINLTEEELEVADGVLTPSRKAVDISEEDIDEDDEKAI